MAVIGPKFKAAIQRKKIQKQRKAFEAFRPTSFRPGTLAGAAKQSTAETATAIQATRAAVQKISKSRGISSAAAASVLRQVAAGTFKEPTKVQVATRAGTATRRTLVRGVREVGGVVDPSFPGLESTTTARIQRRIGSSIRTGTSRALSSVIATKGPTGGAARVTLREVKKFGKGFFGR